MATGPYQRRITQMHVNVFNLPAEMIKLLHGRALRHIISRIV
jgi:hypothetical protein